jgi:PAS domain-containing protein
VYRWFNSRALPLRDANGRIVRWYNLLTDIDDRKNAEKKLRRSEKCLLEAQRLSQTGSWRHDVASGAVTVSPQIHRIFGSSPDEDTSNAEFSFNRTHPEELGLQTRTWCHDQRANIWRKNHTEKLPAADGQPKYWSDAW